MSKPSPDSGLPQAIRPYVDGASKMSLDQFLAACPSPFFLFSKSKLWEPTLLMQHAGGGGGETRVVSYDVEEGGMAFIVPIRKRRGAATQPGVLLGRTSQGNDLVIPVSSVSTNHCRLNPPDLTGGRSDWSISDLGSRNGTYVDDQRVDSLEDVILKTGQFLRFGGNLIAWFFEPKQMYEVLRSEEKLRYYTTH